MPAGGISGQTHAGDVNMMASEESSQITHYARPVLVFQQQHHTRGHNLRRLAKYPNNARIIRRTEKSASSGEDLFLIVEGLHVKPFVEGDWFIGAFLLHR